MLEYFAYKKVKKHNEEKRAKSQSPGRTMNRAHSSTAAPTSPFPRAPPVATQARQPVLTSADEEFLRQITSDDPNNRPSLPTRPTAEASAAQWEPSAYREAGSAAGNNQQLVLHQSSVENDPAEAALEATPEVAGAARARESAAKPSRLQGLKDRLTRKMEAKPTPDDGLTPDERDKLELTKALSDLHLSAEGKSAFSLSAETRVILQKFIQILKDMVNGVPTVYDDLTKLFDSSQEYFDKTYDTLPGFLKKLIKTLPSKIPMGPELMAAMAAKAEMGREGNQGMSFKQAAKGQGLHIPSLKELIAAPGAALTMLRAILNFLKLRWPALLGTNVLWSMGIFLLLFVFYYCWKRGRQERLKAEALADGTTILGSDGKPLERNFEELSSSDGESIDSAMLRSPTGSRPASRPRHARSESRSLSRVGASRRSLQRSAGSSRVHSRQGSGAHGPPSPLRQTTFSDREPVLPGYRSTSRRTPGRPSSQRSASHGHRDHYADHLSPTDGPEGHRPHRWEERRRQHQMQRSYEDDEPLREGIRRSQTEGTLRGYTWRRFPSVKEADRPSQAPISSQESCRIV